MRAIRILFYGDSLVYSPNDEAGLGGIPGRVYDLLTTQFGAASIQLVGQFAVAAHSGQFHEGHGGQESQALLDGVDNLLVGSGGALPSNLPLCGARGRHQNIDIFIDMGGGGDVNDHLVPATWATMQLNRLIRIRERLNQTDPNCIIVVAGGCTDWGGADAPTAAANHQSVLDYNALYQSNVVTPFNALYPTQTLKQGWDWYNVTGLYSVNGVAYWGGSGVDIVHFNAAGNTVQAAALAPVLAPYVQAIREASMGTLSTYAKNALIDHFRNKTTHTPAATHYYHLYVNGVAVSGNGYAVLSKTNNTTTYSNAASRNKTNAIDLTWASPSGGNWGNVDEVRITDNATAGAGNELARDTFTAVPVGTTAGPGSTDTGPFSIPAGFLTISAGTPVATGGLADAVVHGLLDLMFGATAYTQLVTTYGSYWAGDPQGGGAQAGSRVALTQATKWGAASSGVAVTASDTALTQQVSGTYWAEHDASVAGNLLLSTPRPATVGANGTIVAGSLKTTLT